MRTSLKTFLGVAAAGSLMFSLAACSPAESTATAAPAASSSSSAAAEMPKPLASIPALTGVSTAVKLDASFAAALETLKLTPGTVGTAELTDGSLVFPITGGKVDYYDPAKDYRPYVQGLISHAGSGFSLTAGETTVDLTNFTIDPGTSKLYGDVAVNGTTAVKQAYIFNLDGSTLKPLQAAGDTAVLEGTRVLISDTAAGLLNKTFNTDAVKADMLVGIAKITVNTK
ncbi:hypothetical protein [Arthrobacter sp. PAMC25284]|uniref:hypothetical protein n=1 Tax=Arthrobacter sp. PAMC25284 TaxID=2861279 RepID=UPI001C639C76|nr:hypothetical protein [Arthrobacter sp. PAMC25284]QYF89850.1 hypothetical protein KY499_00010 [Arthrobacter sp. PAMC25284]QYF89855.1 hypothetical protein KY499_00040 [Arthrobacter sp. PAMC25284]